MGLQIDYTSLLSVIFITPESSIRFVLNQFIVQSSWSSIISIMRLNHEGKPKELAGLKNENLKALFIIWISTAQKSNDQHQYDQIERKRDQKQQGK